MAGANRARLDAALARALPQVQPPPRDPLDGFGAPMRINDAGAPFPFPQRGPPADWEREENRRPGAGVGAMAGSVRPPVFPQPGPELEYERDRRLERDWAAGRNIPPRPETVPLNPFYAAGRNVREVARGLGDYGRDWASRGMPTEGYEPAPVGRLEREAPRYDTPGRLDLAAPRYREPSPFPFSPDSGGTQFEPEAAQPFSDPLADLAGRPGFAPPGGDPEDEREAMFAFEAELARAGIATARERRHEPLPDPRAQFYDGPLAVDRAQEPGAESARLTGLQSKARDMRKADGPDSKNLQREAYRPIGGGPAVMDLVEQAQQRGETFAPPVRLPSPREQAEGTAADAAQRAQDNYSPLNEDWGWIDLTAGFLSDTGQGAADLVMSPFDGAARNRARVRGDRWGRALEGMGETVLSDATLGDFLDEWNAGEEARRAAGEEPFDIRNVDLVDTLWRGPSRHGRESRYEGVYRDALADFEERNAELALEAGQPFFGSRSRFERNAADDAFEADAWTTGSGALELIPGVGLADIPVSLGRAGLRSGLRAAGREVPEALARPTRLSEVQAPGAMTETYRGNRNAALAAGGIGAGYEALDGEFGDDPIPSALIGAGTVAALRQGMGPRIAGEAAEGTLQARRIGDEPSPIDVEAFPVEGPADAVARPVGAGVGEDVLSGLGPRTQRINLPEPFVGSAEVTINPGRGEIEAIMARQGDAPSVRWGVTNDGEMMIWDGHATSHGGIAGDASGFGAGAFRVTGEIEDAMEIDAALSTAARMRGQTGPQRYFPEDFANELGITPETAEQILARDGRLAFPNYGRRQVRAGEQVNRDGSVTPASPIDYDAPDVRLRSDLGMGEDGRFIAGAGAGAIGGAGIGASLNSEAQAQDGNPSDPLDGVILPVLGAGGGAALGAALLRGRGGRGAARGIGEVSSTADNVAMPGDAARLPQNRTTARSWVESMGGGDEGETRALAYLTRQIEGEQHPLIRADLEQMAASIQDRSYAQGERGMFSRDVEEAFPEIYSPSSGAEQTYRPPNGVATENYPFGFRTDQYGGSMLDADQFYRTASDRNVTGQFASDSVEEVIPTSSLIGTQRTVSPDFLSGARPTAQDEPISVLRTPDGDFVFNGHNRFAHAVATGEPNVRAYVYRRQGDGAAASSSGAEQMPRGTEAMAPTARGIGESDRPFGEMRNVSPTPSRGIGESETPFTDRFDGSVGMSGGRPPARRAIGEDPLSGVGDGSRFDSAGNRAEPEQTASTPRTNVPRGAPAGAREYLNQRNARILELIEEMQPVRNARSGAANPNARIGQNLDNGYRAIAERLRQEGYGEVTNNTIKGVVNRSRNRAEPSASATAGSADEAAAARLGMSVERYRKLSARNNRNGAVAGGIGVGAGGLGLAAFGDAEAQEDGVIERDGILIDAASQDFPSARDFESVEVVGDMEIREYSDGSRHVFRVNREGERPTIEYLGAYAGENFETPPVGDYYTNPYDPGMANPDDYRDIAPPADEGSNDLLPRVFPAAVAGLGGRYLASRMGARGAAREAWTFGPAALTDVYDNGPEDLPGTGLVALAPVAAAYGARTVIPAIREASEDTLAGVTDAARRPRLDADLLADPEFVARRRAFARELPMDAPRSRAIGEPDPMRATPSADRDMPIADGRLSAYSEFMAASPTDQLLWMDRLDFVPRPDASRAELGRQVAQRAIGQDIADLPALPPPAAATEPGGPPPMNRKFRTPLEDVAPRTLVQRAGSRPARDVLNTFAEQHGIPRGRNNVETAANIKAAALRDERLRQAARDWGLAAVLGALGLGSVATAPEAEAQSR